MEQTYPAAVYNRSISKRNFWIDDFGVEGKYLSSNGAVAVALIVYFGVIALLVLCCCLCGCRSIYKKRRRQRRLQPAANSTPPTPSAGSQRHQQSNQSRPRSGRMVACFSRSRNARPANDNETSRSRNGGWWWSRSRNTANNNDDIEMGRFRRTLSRALSMNKPRNDSNIPPAAPDMPSTPTFPVPVEPPPLYQPPTTIPTTAYQPPTPTSQSLQNNQIIAGDAWSLRASTPPPLFEERERDILHEEEVEGVRTQGLQYDRPLPPYSMARINENGVADYGWWDRWLLNAAR